MCGCSNSSSFTGSPAPCGCGKHAAFDGSGLNNGTDALTDEAALLLVQQLLVSPPEVAGLSTAEAHALIADRYAKMRYYFDMNKLGLTEANIREYQLRTLVKEGEPQLLARHPYLKTAGFLLLLLALSVGALFFLTREA